MFKFKDKQKMILKKINNFFSNKVPKGDKYPYNIYNTFEVLDQENTGYEKLYLVGDNWKRNKDKPIALVLGCNDWKLGFISDYLKDYRCAFGSRKLNGFKAIRTITKLKIKPEQIIVWGYNEDKILSLYLRSKKIWRLEDGFVRSSALGASHSTPYSLVLDKTGFYYNCHNPSDIENLLNNYNFSENSELIEKSQIALETLLTLKISKYNPPILHKDHSIKIKKTIAVLGQVDGDASIKYGNVSKITSEEMLILAKKENPNAEILYRPHPEVFKGYQKSKLKSKKIENIATLCSPDEDIIEFIERVDHVYTITSLTGLEALLRNKKVTVLGSPFYSGWGLTDDRVENKRRNRKLTLLELFTGIYLLYPKYLANLNDPFIGFMSACFRIKAEREIETHDYFNLKYKEKSFEEIVTSKFFVKLLFSDLKDEIAKYFKEINFNVYLKGETPVLFEKIYLLSIIGILKNEKLENQFLCKVRDSVNLSTYHYILLLLNKYLKKDYLVNHVLWLKKQNISFQLDESLIEVIELSNPNNFINQKIKIEKDDIIQEINLENLKSDFRELVENNNYREINEFISFISKNNISTNSIIEDVIYDYYDYYLVEKDFVKAFHLAEIMLLNNFHTKVMISNLTNYAKIKFDFVTTRLLAQLNQDIDLYAANRNMSLTEINTYGSEDITDIGETNFNCKLVKLVGLKPNAIVSASFVMEKYRNYDIQLLNEIVESTLSLDNEQSIRKAQAFIAIGKANIAVNILENMINNKEKINPTLIIVYTQALSFDNKLELAIFHIEKALKNYINKNIFEEAVRIYVMKNNYQKCLHILNIAFKNNIILGEMYLRKTYFGSKLIKEAFKTFKSNSPKKTISKYYKNKYILDTNILNTIKGKKLLLLSLYGPGDEIRFASTYKKIIEKLDGNKLYITCTPKLQKLFSNSYKNVEFIPVNRLRGFEDYDKVNYDKVKGSDLIQVIDNKGNEAIDNSDHIIMVTDLLGEILTDYSSFEGTPYLNVDLEQKKYFNSILPKDKKLVGLSWRSSLTTHSRNEHYLTIEELEPLFKIDNIQFVNFQYDECSEELAWVEEKYPGKILNIEELNQYDDLDGVAALLKCMDLVIAPATTVIELSGALGCNTWMFSNSSEIDWRKIDNKGTDVWHNSIKIIDTEEKGNKELLVQKLYNNLLDYSNN